MDERIKINLYLQKEWKNTRIALKKIKMRDLTDPEAQAEDQEAAQAKYPEWKSVYYGYNNNEKMLHV